MKEKNHQPEQAPLPEENLPEAEPTRELGDNVRQILNAWVEEYETTASPALKEELAYKILKMTMALSTARLKAEEVKIRQDEEGTLGLYYPETGLSAITEEGLELPAKHYAGVLTHEATHKGRQTGHRIMDEGLTEWYTIHRLQSSLEGDYLKEQSLAKKALAKVGLEQATEVYDYDKPLSLVRMYLKVELTDILEDEKDADPEELLDKNLKRLEEQFKKGLPELYQQLKEREFNFRQEAEAIIQQQKTDKK